MRKVFIDLGANIGQSVDYFERTFGMDYETHCFEPNPKLHKHFEDRYNLAFHKEVAWIIDGEVEFSVRSDLGSTLIPGKTTGGEGTTIKVPCIDFSRWLRQTFSKDDYIFVKMDIEGAEFRLLHHMNHEKSLDMVSQIAIEYHTDKIPAYTAEDEVICNQMILEAGIATIVWPNLDHITV